MENVIIALLGGKEAGKTGVLTALYWRLTGHAPPGGLKDFFDVILYKAYGLLLRATGTPSRGVDCPSISRSLRPIRAST